MPQCAFRAGSALLAVLLFTGCGLDSPTSIAPSLNDASLTKSPETCTFSTNRKTHATPAAGATCPSAGAVSQIAGTYDLTRLLISQEEDDGTESDPFDVAEAMGNGGSFELTLDPNGTTSGHIYVPGNPGEEGSGVDLSLEGTWRINDGTITLDTADEAVIDQVSYTFESGKLIGGEGSWTDVTIYEVVLTRR